MSRLSVGVVALVAALCVGGCGGSEDHPAPKLSSTPASTPASSASQSPSTPTSPPPAPTREAPEAFIKRWLSAYNNFEATGEGDAFVALNLQTCQGCASIADAVQAIYGAGGYIKSTGWTIKAVQPAGQNQLTARIHVAAARYRKSASSRVLTSPAATVLTRFTLSGSQTAWQVAEFERLSR